MTIFGNRDSSYGMSPMAGATPGADAVPRSQLP